MRYDWGYEVKWLIQSSEMLEVEWPCMIDGITRLCNLCIEHDETVRCSHFKATEFNDYLRECFRVREQYTKVTQILRIYTHTPQHIMNDDGQGILQ